MGETSRMVTTHQDPYFYQDDTSLTDCSMPSLFLHLMHLIQGPRLSMAQIFGSVPNTNRRSNYQTLVKKLVSLNHMQAQ